MSKLVVKDKKRFCISIGVIILIIICIILVVGNRNKEVDPALDSRYSKNVDKYSEELKTEYSKPEMKEKFNTIYQDLQEKSINYAFSNVTEDEKSFDVLVEQVNKMFADKDYSKLSETVEDPDFWVGTFKLDKTGKLTFTFKSESIKPDWAKSSEFENIIM